MIVRLLNFVLTMPKKPTAADIDAFQSEHSDSSVRFVDNSDRAIAGIMYWSLVIWAFYAFVIPYAS